MVGDMTDERRHELIQALLVRTEYTEKTLQPLCSAEGQVQVDSEAIANLILHTVLNQLTMMNTLKELLTKEGESVVLAENPSADQN